MVDDGVKEKYSINSKTTAYDLIEKTLAIFPDKFENKDPNKKILKVRSENDYIFNIREPLIYFSYINECVKLNKNPEYLIVDNPELDLKSASGENRTSVKNRRLQSADNVTGLLGIGIIDLNENMEDRIINNKVDLQNIAKYNPMLTKVNDDMCKITDSLEKEVNKGKKYISSKKEKSSANENNQNQTSNFTLDDLINSFNEEIENEINNKIKKYDPNKRENFKIKEDEKNNDFYKEKMKKFSFLQLNCNSSRYLQKKSKYKTLPMNQVMPDIYCKTGNASNNLNNGQKRPLTGDKSSQFKKNANLQSSKKNFTTNNDKSKTTPSVITKERNPLMIKKKNKFI